MKFTKSLFKKKNQLAVLIITGLILTIGLNKPFVGHHDFNSVFYGSMAKNYLRFGFLKTKFGQITSVLSEAPLKFGFHTHHPPLLPVFMALSFKLFGPTEAAARTVPIISSLIGVLFFYHLGTKFFSKQTAFFSSLFFVLTPMFIYYGKLPVHEPLVLGLSLFLISQYFLWIKTKNNKYFFLLVPGLIMAELTGWPSYYLPVIFFIYSLFFIRKREIIQKILILIPLSAFTFSLLLYQNYLLTGNLFGGGLLKAFLFRLDIDQRAATYPFTLPQFFRKEILWSSIFFTKTLIFLSLFYFIKVTFEVLKTKKISFSQSIIFTLLVFGLIHPLIFRNAAFLHDYLLYYLLPFLALSGALGLQTLIKFLSKTFKTKVVKDLSVVIFLSTALIIATEKIKFLDALQKSNSHLDAVSLGKLIKQNINPEEEILVIGEKFINYKNFFVNFYSEHQKISFQKSLDFNNIETFDWLIFSKESPEITFKELNLLQKYPQVEKQDYLIFKLK